MNRAAQALGQLSGAIRHQRSREPVLAKARELIPAGQPIPAALLPEYLLTSAERAR